MAGVGNFQPACCCCSCFFGLTFPLFVRQFFSCVKIFFFHRPPPPPPPHPMTLLMIRPFIHCLIFPLIVLWFVPGLSLSLHTPKHNIALIWLVARLLQKHCWRVGGGEGGSKAREMVTDKSLRHGKNWGDHPEYVFLCCKVTHFNSATVSPPPESLPHPTFHPKLPQPFRSIAFTWFKSPLTELSST